MSLGLVLVLVLSGCGSADDGAPSAQESTSEQQPESPSPASPSSSPPAAEPEGPFVPGNPQNQFRPASAQELRDWPVCGAIWRRDGTIPRGYEGCVRNGSSAIVADRIGCSFGGAMTTYFDRYYGVIGNVVNDARAPLSQSREYARAYGQCSG